MSYRLVVAHMGRDELAQTIKGAISKVLVAMNIDAEQLAITDELSNESVNQALAYLASTESRVDLKVNAMIQEALDSNIPVIPIAMHDEESTIAEKLPASLSHHNAAFWQDDGITVAMSLLRALGLTETDRKVFISYRRSETSDLADQMHTALVRRGFDVFLDRFSLYPGNHFPRRIEENLSDKALVLLLESNGLQESVWVRREIDYAAQNHIRMLALNLPDCENNVSKIDDNYRFRLATGDLTLGKTLTPQALSRNTAKIELAHAVALQRRRRQLLGGLMDKLAIKGYSCQQVGDWCVLAQAGQTEDAHLFWVTPRRPATTDFYGLCRQHDRIASEFSSRLSGTVVYDLPQLSAEHQALMDWQARVSGKGLKRILDI